MKRSLEAEYYQNQYWVISYCTLFGPPPHHLSTILVHGARLICSKSNMWAQRPAPSLPGRYARPKRLS